METSQPGQRDDDFSVALSPTNTRRPSRSDPMAARDMPALSDSVQSTETMRRRSENMDAPASQSLASCQAPTQTENSAPERSHQRNTQQLSAGARSPLLGPDRGRIRPRKPPMTRRASSNAQAPHRGEIFSVDDAVNEVEADAAQRQQSYAATVRRRTAAAPSFSRVNASAKENENEDESDTNPPRNRAPSRQQDELTFGGTAEIEEVEVLPEGSGDSSNISVDESYEDDEGDVSDAESFTLKDRQQAINETHPFGIRIWKPALYKKDRSVQKTAENDIHSSLGFHVSRWLVLFNMIWTLAFGWWLALISYFGAIVCFLFAATRSGRQYGRVMWGLAGYLFYPFGKVVRLEQQEAYIDEDQGEGRSISEYEQWQSGDLEHGRLFFGPDRNRSIIGRSRRSLDSEPDETDSLLGRGTRGVIYGVGASDSEDTPRLKRRLFGRGKWNIGRVIFFIFFYFMIAPLLLLASLICWFLVFWIPMGKVTILLFSHLRRHPLALSFEADGSSARSADTPHASILVCTYRAVGTKYWKYTIDGTNIFFINLMSIVVLVIFDWFVLAEYLNLKGFITSPGFLFPAGLLSIIPLAYFIGQAVASISAQSSMGVGAAINALFSTIVEVFLYCEALMQGKSRLVEGSVIGSIFAGVLFLPGLSMCFGAIKRKTQRFNSKSAGVTSTMLLFAVIGAFGPTLFYQIYGTHELNCAECVDYGRKTFGERDCRRCFFSQTPSITDRFYLEAVRPFCYLAATTLFLSYIIGLWFTLRTHAAVIWNADVEEKRHEERTASVTPYSSSGFPNQRLGDSTSTDIRNTHLYKRVLGQSLRQAGLNSRADEHSRPQSRQGSAQAAVIGMSTPRTVPPKPIDNDVVTPGVHILGLSEAENNDLVHRVAEIAAAAATVAARDSRFSRLTTAHGHHSMASNQHGHASVSGGRPAAARTATIVTHDGAVVGHAEGGHDAPNWSRTKSTVILCGATIMYAAVAEILVNTVDVVLEGFAVDEKFLGITLFALVPNTTEFLNAISFAMNGNIALSMEIGSAYALQVCLLQIPALVLFSALNPLPNVPIEDLWSHSFTLLFPQWDMVTTILCVFLLSYMYGEGKSNYFKGSILLLTYVVVVIGFFYSGYGGSMDGIVDSTSRFDTMGNDGAWVTHKTVGRGIHEAVEPL